MTMIAFPTDDGQNISRHLGQALFFVVVPLEGEATEYEFRSKPAHGADDGHTQQIGLAQEHEDSRGEDKPHGVRARRMLDPISDCQVLIAGGMGRPAYEGAISAGLQVILTGERTIPAALSAFRAGTLKSDLRRVHNHH